MAGNPGPSKKGRDKTKAKKKITVNKIKTNITDLDQIRNVVRATINGAIKRDEDLEKVRESLKMRFQDPTVSKIVDEEISNAKTKQQEISIQPSDKKDEKKSKEQPPSEIEKNGILPQQDNTLQQTNQPPTQDKSDEQPSEKDIPEEKADDSQGNQNPSVDANPSSSQGLASGQNNGGIQPQRLRNKVQNQQKNDLSSNPCMQDIPLASLPGGDTPLPTLSQSLSSDLRKYADEKAWHDAWKSGGSKTTGGVVPIEQPKVSLGDRAILVGYALGKGGVSGLARFAGELAIETLIQQGSKKIPYLSGFVELTQIGMDLEGWFKSNYDATLDKLLKKGWNQLFGEEGDFFTRVEGIINLLDGAANIIGLLGSICQVFAAILFAGGLIGSIFFGVGAALVSAAPVVAKFGLVLGEISGIIKLAINGLRPLIIAGRAVQILADGDADPSTLAARAESLEKTMDDWTKEFTKAKVKKLVDKPAKKPPKDVPKIENSKSSQGTGANIAKPDKPKSLFDRLKALGGGALDVLSIAGGGSKGEIQTKGQNVKEGFGEVRKLGKNRPSDRSDIIYRRAKKVMDAEDECNALRDKERRLKADLQNTKMSDLDKIDKREELAKVEKQLAIAEKNLEVAEKEVRIAMHHDGIEYEYATKKDPKKPVIGHHIKETWKDIMRKGLATGDEKVWRGKHEKELRDEKDQRKQQMVEQLSKQYISIGQSLPPPPLDAEGEVDQNSKRHELLTNEIQQIEFQRKTLEEMKKDAEVEKTGLDVLNKLALANKAQIDMLNQEGQHKNEAIQNEKSKVQEMTQASTTTQQAGQKGQAQTSFLSKLANILGMVPSKIAGNAGEGVQGAQKLSQVLVQLGQTSQQTQSTTQGAQNMVQQQENITSEANAKIKNAQATQDSLVEQQLALEAETIEGQTYIEKGLALAEAKKKEKEAEREKTVQEYVNAKKRLLAWAIMHEQIRKGQETSFEEALQKAEKQFGQMG